jgi:predicted amidohydrolase
MSRKMTLASAQYPITRHRDFKDWQRHTEDWIRRAMPEHPQLLLFPEYGSMELVSLLPETEQADIMLQVRGMDRLRDDFCSVFTELARRYATILVAPSFPVIEGKKVYNRCFVFGPSGQTGYQDKYFMTRFENETWKVSRAPARLCVFETGWGCFGVQICYDVEFPIGAALLSRSGAQLILAPSCTETIRGAARVHTGARARALEQQCFVAVSQTVGDAPWSETVDINYGYAGFYTPADLNFPEEGILKTGHPQSPCWQIQHLDFSKIDQVRQNGQVLNFQDQAGIQYAISSDSFEMVRVIL